MKLQRYVTGEEAPVLRDTPGPVDDVIEHHNLILARLYGRATETRFWMETKRDVGEEEDRTMIRAINIFILPQIPGSVALYNCPDHYLKTSEGTTVFSKEADTSELPQMTGAIALALNLTCEPPTVCIYDVSPSTCPPPGELLRIADGVYE